MFLEIAQFNPHSAHAHHNLGIAYLRCGRFAEGAESLQRAIGLDPGMTSALPNLAYALEREGRTQEAMAAYRSASRTAAGPDERQHYLANALVLEGRPEEAERELGSLVARAPTSRGPGAFSRACLPKTGGSKRRPSS
jgi:Flp pilus assembly protein TadD